MNIHLYGHTHKGEKNVKNVIEGIKDTYKF